MKKYLKKEKIINSETSSNLSWNSQILHKLMLFIRFCFEKAERALNEAEMEEKLWKNEIFWSNRFHD
jgi:hypothetical protein